MTANKATTKENKYNGTRGQVHEDQHRNNRKRKYREEKKVIQEHFLGLMDISFQTK